MACNKKISVITVYTNTDKLSEALSWLEKQSVYPDVELVMLDNRENRFSSCAQALNYGAEHSCGEYLVFMHQDVYLWDLQALEKYVAYLSENPDAIIGVAGVPRGMKTVTDVYETKEKIRRGNRAYGKEYEVESLDECLIAMTRAHWQELPFDEQCCDNWHCYGVDMCFANTLRGGRNIMLPLEICHDSQGDARNNSYRATIRNLIRKYHGTAIQRINTTCLDIPCNWPAFWWYYLKGNLKDLLRRIGLVS